MSRLHRGKEAHVREHPGKSTTSPVNTPHLADHPQPGMGNCESGHKRFTKAPTAPPSRPSTPRGGAEPQHSPSDWHSEPPGQGGHSTWCPSQSPAGAHPREWSVLWHLPEPWPARPPFPPSWARGVRGLATQRPPKGQERTPPCDPGLALTWASAWALASKAAFSSIVGPWDAW